MGGRFGDAGRQDTGFRSPAGDPPPGPAPYMVIHEHKIGRKRWIGTLTLQNRHPAEE